MKITILLLATVLFTGSAWAQTQDDYQQCVAWSYMEEREKTSFILGWLLGVESADLLTKDIIMPKLWPTGHRVGSVKIEIDVLCKRAENKNTDLSAIIQQIASEKNR